MDNGLCLSRLMGSLKLGLAVKGGGCGGSSGGGCGSAAGIITYVSRNGHKIGGTCVSSHSPRNGNGTMMMTTPGRKKRLLATVSLTPLNTAKHHSSLQLKPNANANANVNANSYSSPTYHSNAKVNTSARVCFIPLSRFRLGAKSNKANVFVTPSLRVPQPCQTDHCFRQFSSSSSSSSTSTHSPPDPVSDANAAASAAASWTHPYKRKDGRNSSSIDAFGTWDSTTALPLIVEQSIAHGKPIPKVLASSMGASSVKGRRATQEDQYAIEPIFIDSSEGQSSSSSLNNQSEFLYWAVYDGHGGSDCSLFCAQEMPKHIARWIDAKTKELESGDPDSKELDLTAVLHNAFLELNDSFAQWYNSHRRGAESDSSGCTATVVLLQNSTRLAIGHVGDSRAILCRSGEARKLTTDHVPSLITEKTRIEKSGGKITNGRVNERLNMTRSIGDLELKRFGVIAEPEVRIMNINHSRDSFLVLTTDGINSVMTDKEIIETVKQAEDPTVAAHLLTDTAVQYSSEDNSTAIVTPFGSWLKYSAAATIFHNFGKSFASSSRFG